MVPLLFILTHFCSCEIFQFSAPGEEVRVMFRLNPDNINTGYFLCDPENKMRYKAEIRSMGGDRKLACIEEVSKTSPIHFSFNNKEIDEIVVVITSSYPEEDYNSKEPEFVEMKFDSALDTFNKDVSKRSQISPAIYTLERLLKKLKDITSSSKNASGQLYTLGRENRSLLLIVFIFNLASFVVYAILNALQLYFTKQYLSQKKYL